MATIYVDGKQYTVGDGQNLLQACLSAGLNLPYFCWHPALGSVGACRQCAVKQFRDEKDTRGRIVMACMTPASDGTRISIQDADVVAFRASVIEWLMENHPHDCPVCDEGGECHLQDMTVMTGHVYRRFRFAKRTYRNQYLGPFVNHEMNRCIQCYRCVRFYNDYANGRDLGAFRAHDEVYFGRAEPGVLENEFSGNLVEICPTGVFTDKTLKRHYTRKWDLQTAPSICVNCGLGCNTIPGERYGTLRRILNRFNGAVNGYFLCDRGRYGYEFVNDEGRIRRPIDKVPPPAGGLSRLPEASTETGGQTPARRALLSRLTGLIREPNRVIGIGSPRASLEANFALRELVGPERFYSGLGEVDERMARLIVDILQRGPARSASLEEVRASDAVFVLGDPTQFAPVLALALRQSVRNQPIKDFATRARIPRWDDSPTREITQDRKGPLAIASVAPTRLDDIASLVYRAAPDDLARLGFAVAAALGADVVDLGDIGNEVRELAATIAQALRSGEKPLIVAGTEYMNEAILQAAADVAWALNAAGVPAQLAFTVHECNTLGVALMASAGGTAGNLGQAFYAAQNKRVDTAIVLENDLYLRADAIQVDAFLGAVRHMVVLDSLLNPTSRAAELALPASTFAEGDGTLVNNEGRAQRFYQVFPPNGEIQESWRWLRDIGLAAGRDQSGGWRNLDDVSAALAAALPVFQPILEIAPPASYRIAGQKIAREPARYSGRTAMFANIDVYEPKPPEDPDSPLNFSMEGFHGDPPPALIPRFWAPGWNSVQSLNKFQEEVGGPLRGGNPGRRLIEPPGAPPAAGPATLSGEPAQSPPGSGPAPAAGPAAGSEAGPPQQGTGAPPEGQASPQPVKGAPGTPQQAGSGSGETPSMGTGTGPAGGSPDRAAHRQPDQGSRTRPINAVSRPGRPEPARPGREQPQPAQSRAAGRRRLPRSISRSCLSRSRRAWIAGWSCRCRRSSVLTNSASCRPALPN